MEAQTEVQITQLDPQTVLADDNSRFGLKQSRIDTLAEAILEAGQVNDAVEVEPLTEPVEGKQYCLTVGHYRHAAVLALNAQGAGMTLPAIIRVRSAVDRLKRQVSENLDRENQSPMDQAVAMKRLLDAGVSKMDVRKMYSKPGGRKGNKVQPLSNSSLNMTISFLDLPKSIQTKIHEGLVGVGAAYELTKVPPDKRAAVLERAEAERISALEAEEKADEKFLAAEAKKEEANKKQQDLEAEQTAAKAAFEAAQKTAADAAQAAKAMYEAKATAVSSGKTATKYEIEAREKAFKEAEAKSTFREPIQHVFSASPNF
jgi:ParB-like chromosome segregation protein Spo0J